MLRSFCAHAAIARACPRWIQSSFHPGDLCTNRGRDSLLLKAEGWSCRSVEWGSLISSTG
jgi:hypothetical protein